MFLDVTRLLEQVLAGEPPSQAQGLAILTAHGAAFTAYLAGAHHLKELAFGKRVTLCSIINAKSGRCPENCAFCAQSAHHSTDVAVYPLIDEESLVTGARNAENAGSSCYGIITSGTTVSPAEVERICGALRRIRQETAIAPACSLGIIDLETAQALREAAGVAVLVNRA